MLRVAKFAAIRSGPTPVIPSRAAVLSRQAMDGAAHATTIAPRIVHDVLASGGQPLDRAARASMESQFGYDFSQVRVHTDDIAAASAQRLGARAYAVANRLVFNRGEYRPASADGRELLGHELAHVAQWKAGGSHKPTGNLSVAPAAGTAEREADAWASRGGPVSPMSSSGVHCKLKKKGNVPMGEYAIEMDKSLTKGPAYDHVEITFTPSTKSPSTDEIQFIQIIKPALSPKGWTKMRPEEADLEQFTTVADPKSGIKGDYHVDINPVGKKPREPGMPMVSPDYPHLLGTGSSSSPLTGPNGLTLGGGAPIGPRPGFHRPPNIGAARMTDDPGGGPVAGTFSFETVAYDKQHGFGYGTVYWGFDYVPTPSQGNPYITNEEADVKNELSPTFLDAVRRFQKFYKS